jgi:phage gpG-like protein
MSGMFIISGAEEAQYVAGLFEAGAGQGENTRTVMDMIVADMLRIEKIIFRAQGRRGGGSWKALAPDTLRKKGIGGYNILRTDLARPGYSKIDGHISSDTLYRSMTEFGAPYQILAVTRNNIMFGTTRPYAGAHQHGSWIRFIPARPFMRFLPTDQTRWMRLINEHLMKPFLFSKGKKA